MENVEGFLLINLYALILIIFISIVFFCKERLNKFEDKLYGHFLIYSVVVNLSGLLLGFLVVPEYNVPMVLQLIVNKIYLIALLFWINALTAYTLYASSDKKDNFDKKLKVFWGFNFLNIIMALILPMNIAIKGNSAVPEGLAYMYAYSVFFVEFLFQIACVIRHPKNLINKKFVPIYILATLGTAVIVNQMINPEMNYLINPLFIFIAIVMYHTIENPDVKMIEELNIAKGEAERANSAKTEFLANMSHEIRTPLNAITGFSQALAEEEGMPEAAKEDIKDIIMASNSLLEIVNGVLDISKIEANKIEIINKTYDPYVMFKELESLTKIRIGEKPIDFNVYIDATIPERLFGDHVRVKQIILNLLTNAAKYTEEGKIDFKISSVIREDICRLIISVEDSGRGIKSDKIDKLFTKFNRLDEEENITIEGTGLGLAITKKLLEMMNGKITVQSVYGQGSKFTAFIDQKIVTDEDVLEKEIEDAEEEIEVLTDEVEIVKRKVLIVDDNKLNLKVAEKLLSKYPLVISVVQSGMECIELVKKEEFDLILLDDMMPKMSGKDTLVKLKEINGFDIPTIALTANALSGMREEYLSFGFDDYLAKPIEKVELEMILKKYLDI